MDGTDIDHHGAHYTVENARLWTLPASPPDVVMSAFGPQAVEVAARISEGFYCAWPAAGLLEQYRGHGGTGPAIGRDDLRGHGLAAAIRSRCGMTV